MYFSVPVIDIDRIPLDPRLSEELVY